MSSIEYTIRTKGKVMASVLLVSSFCIASLLALFDIQVRGGVPSAQATSTATTTVRVLNTPPAWTVTARELYASATTTPTNSGTSTIWTATASDSNGENYYLLVCKASSTPTPNPSAAPTCGGGLSDQWGVSASIVSGSAATVSTTTTESMPEKNDWYAYVCDANAGSPRCNATMYNGLQEIGAASATSSPFVVNHRPTFTLAADNSPTAPGSVVTWTTTATDTTDVIRGGDQLRLFVCRQAIFDATIPSCAGTGGWATSSFTTLGNPSTSTTITIPSQDGNLGAYVYIIDEFNHTASGGWQASSTVLTISNVAPYVASSTIELYDVYGSTTLDTTLALVTQEGQTQAFVARFDVSDDNGCLNMGSTNEIIDVDINAFRSAIGGAYGLGCDASGEYNANNCYTHTNTNWAPTCYQVPGAACTASTLSVAWECTFPLWYIADPTDVGSQYAGQDWRVSARGTDDNTTTGAYSTEDEAANSASEVIQFLSFRATGSPIAYGSWEPGQNTGVHIATTTVYATGNTGLDQYLSGDAMCVTYPTCTGYATSTIYVPYQHYATTSSGIAYASGYELSTSTTPVFVNVTIQKTTSTSSPTNDDTYWGIAVPSNITFAGDYIGRNYIDAVVSASSEW